MPPRILHVSDVEGAHDRPERLGRLAGLLGRHRDAAGAGDGAGVEDAAATGDGPAGSAGNANDGATLVTVGGDCLAPSVLSLVTDGRGAVEGLRALAPDATTLGNHDFDPGPAAARRAMAAAPGRWVCANAFEGGRRFGAGAGVVPWTVREAGDATVAVVGVTRPDTDAGNPAAAGLDFDDPAAAVDRALADEPVARADHVVVLAHLGRKEVGEGTATAAGLAAAVDGDAVDAVLDGHSSRRTVRTVGGTLLARPGGSDADAVVAVDLDPGSGSRSGTGTGGGAGADFESGTGTAPGSAPTATVLDVSGAPLDRSVADGVRDRKAAAGLDEVVGHVRGPVRCDRPATRAGESRVGNLVVDAYRQVAGADVAVQLPGGIRARPPLRGGVAVEDLVGLVPFDDDLVTVELDGRALRRALAELSVVPSPHEVPTWQFGHLSGGTVVYDDAAGRLRAATVGGDLLDPDRRYGLATSAYYLGNDRVLTPLNDRSPRERHGPQYEAVVAYARGWDRGSGFVPGIEGRIERPTLAAAGSRR